MIQVHKEVRDAYTRGCMPEGGNFIGRRCQRLVDQREKKSKGDVRSKRKTRRGRRKGKSQYPARGTPKSHWPFSHYPQTFIRSYRDIPPCVPSLSSRLYKKAVVLFVPFVTPSHSMSISRKTGEPGTVLLFAFACSTHKFWQTYYSSIYIRSPASPKPEERLIYKKPV